MSITLIAMLVLFVLVDAAVLVALILWIIRRRRRQAVQGFEVVQSNEKQS